MDSSLPREGSMSGDSSGRWALKTKTQAYISITLCFFLFSSLAQAFDQPQPEPQGALITLLTIIYKVLNKTTPDIGQDCWLCQNPKPLYYVSVKIPLNLTELSRLELQVNSLVEVVLQNRRGLNLFFVEQNGLCMALSETCCFYANNSGIIRENLLQVQRNLDARERQRLESNN
uniref:Uncharacterized protein n=1 Tax=Rousettus aegyptiacus TaxID=9407 RepID=A0A7J8BEV8_ROUAE|nr:hypothetical protein HJG63_009886 [Rousettus aegyptiacus]